MNIVECKELTKTYGRKKTALSNISFTLVENKITGLVGRNGAGKTTLLKILAGFLQKTSGEVQVFAEDPFNSLKVSANTIFMSDEVTFNPSFTLGEIFQAGAMFCKNWDNDLALQLLDYFSIQSNSYHANLSKGMKSTFNMIVGLAARAPLTLLDEPTTGMDAAVRKDFYRALLKDYLAYPRTIVLSSHLLNEMEELFEDILLINNGTVHLHLSIEDLREYAIAITGKTAQIEELLMQTEVIHEQLITPDNKYVAIKRDESIIQKAKLLGIDCTSVSVSDLCIYLTSKSKGGIDDVFNRN